MQGPKGEGEVFEKLLEASLMSDDSDMMPTFQWYSLSSFMVIEGHTLLLQSTTCSIRVQNRDAVFVPGYPPPLPNDATFVTAVTVTQSPILALIIYLPIISNPDPLTIPTIAYPVFARLCLTSHAGYSLQEGLIR